MVKGGSIAAHGAEGKIVRKGAKPRRRFTFKLTTQDGQEVTKTLNLRAARKGDASGKPLGC